MTMAQLKVIGEMMHCENITASKARMVAEVVTTFKDLCKKAIHTAKAELDVEQEQELCIEAESDVEQQSCIEAESDLEQQLCIETESDLEQDKDDIPALYNIAGSDVESDSVTAFKNHKQC